MANFNLPQIYQQAFGGHVGLPFPGSRADVARVNILKMFGKDIYEAPAVKPATGFNVPTVPEWKPGLRTSVLGTPIYMPVKICLPGEDITRNDDLFWLPNEPLLEFNGGAEIVQEPKAGGNGSFKEFMGLNDYEITIRGVAVNEEDIDEYPEKDVARIRQLCESGQPLEARSPLLRLFGISMIAIKSWRFPAAEGLYSAQAYELQCLSDEPVELVLKETDYGNI